MTTSSNSFNARSTLNVGQQSYTYYALPKAEANGLNGLSNLPFSLRVLAENLLRCEDGQSVTSDDLKALANWGEGAAREIAFRPARVLMQDFTGVPAIVDLAAMRDAMQTLGKDANKINPLVPVDLVIDHSVIVDESGSPKAVNHNVELEYKRNGERYRFLRWGQQAFDNFRVVAPGTGICHQVNLEYLSKVVWSKNINGETVVYPDTLVGTDSHTTMVNGLAVLGWGVGGIEAEAAMLGQPISMLIPDVIGFRLTGALNEGVTATDLVLSVVQMIRKHGAVGKFVEFCGDGLDHLSLADRATIANMAPEYGATCGYFPIDDEALRYLRNSGREHDQVDLVEAYAKAQGLFREKGMKEPTFSSMIELDLSTVVPSMAGPKRPQDKIELGSVSLSFNSTLGDEFKKDLKEGRYPVAGSDYDFGHGDVAIAAITSCTNTSNPSVMLAAGLLARNARARGLQAKPWVKTSLAPGSQVVAEYLRASGLQEDLDALGFNVVGFGCTTCIGNSGPLAEEISRAIHEYDIIACSVLSGNRNFEGRVNPDVRANYLASPPLVVAYALSGSVRTDLENEPLGVDKDNNPVYLKDIWPSNSDINNLLESVITREMFQERYKSVFTGDERWQEVSGGSGQTYQWSDASTYVRNPPYFEGMAIEPSPVVDIDKARVLGLFLDSITTDHISPAGSIQRDGPAGNYLSERQVRPIDFNQYGARRGNHDIMMRGTFANIRIKNQMMDGKEGGYTVHQPSGEAMSIFDAAMRYADESVPLVVFAGKEYGTGSSRDWAAKGTRLLGVRAVIAESFERIHRSNLIGMGVLPLVFTGGQNWQTLGLDGSETVSIKGLSDIQPQMTVTATVTRASGEEIALDLLCRIDTLDELAYYQNGGILHYVLRQLAS